ncbi:MAG: hypothetical protein ACK5LX_13840 [Oscillospiraceae bacterium]
MSILPNVSGILSLMYTDRMTVQRYVPGTGPDGESAKVLQTVPELVDVPCRISLGSKDSPVMTDDANRTDLRPTLICGPKVPLKNADLITVQRLVDKDTGTWVDVYSGNIGRPNLFGSSLQAMFQDKGNA